MLIPKAKPATEAKKVKKPKQIGKSKPLRKQTEAADKSGKNVNMKSEDGQVEGEAQDVELEISEHDSFDGP